MNNDLAVITDRLQEIPGFDVHQAPDATDLLMVRGAQQTILLRVVTRNSGYPRDVRQAVWQAQKEVSHSEQILVTAPSLSPGSREWLRQEGIAYSDAVGHLFLAAEGVYILRDDLARNTHARHQFSETNIFRGRTTQVLHTLLHAPACAWHVTDLAQDAGVAAGTALRVCETLEKMLLMERSGRGPQSLRRLTSPGKLLDAWAAEYELTGYDIRRFYRWHADLNGLAILVGDAVEAQDRPYAATLALGAMHRAPFLTQTDQIALIVPSDADVPRIAHEAQLKAVDDGANVLLLRAKQDAPLMYRQQDDGLWIASDIQLYLDLNASPARGKEQAEHLRCERLGF